MTERNNLGQEGRPRSASRSNLRNYNEVPQNVQKARQRDCIQRRPRVALGEEARLCDHRRQHERRPERPDPQVPCSRGNESGHAACRSDEIWALGDQTNSHKVATQGRDAYTPSVVVAASSSLQESAAATRTVVAAERKKKK